LIDFARDVCGTPFYPWQEWLAVRVGELLDDGRPRFRTVLILVARQNGKTTFAKVLTLFWMFLERAPLTMNTSTDRSYAKRFWSDVCETAQTNPHFAGLLGPNAIKRTISEESLKTLDGAELTFAANNGRAGRSMTLHRWLCDELREHHSRDCWDSATNAQNAVADAQTVCVTNQGDDSSVVLDSLRTPAIEYIETGVGDPRLGLFEWSAADGADPTDPRALAAANPNVGYRLDMDVLRAAGARAEKAGGVELAGFRTEVLCQRVALLDPAIDPDSWAASATSQPIDLARHRERVAMCLDVSMDGLHASLVAAAVIDGRVVVDAVAAWHGVGCTKQLRAELPGIVARVRPRVLGWFPLGPAAVLLADMQANRARQWPPRRVTLEEIRTETTAACMGLAELVRTGEVVHFDDPMLNSHVNSAQKLRRGDGWVYTRRSSGPVDGAYATAGAVHLARTLPAAPPPLAVL
jgi:phage terminase large subunit-like protein